MKKLLRRLYKNEDGNILLLAAAALGGLLFMTGLVIDGGNLFTTKSHLQKTANAAALSGAQELPLSQEAVTQIVNDVLSSHNESESLQEIIYENGFSVNVVLEKNLPLFFLALFGKESISIQVNAKAGLKEMSSTEGVVPLGIDESTNLEYGKSYPLKVGPGDSVEGFFGILALEKKGAKAYGETLKYGYQEKISIGETFLVQTGNISGATRDGIQYRMDRCPYPEGQFHHRDCARVISIIVYKPSIDKSTVEVTGFAYFYITENLNSKGEINGIFIKRTGSGTAGDVNGKTPADRGAYVVTLME
ncbi:Putative Flp pilus-assembly TadE/G-like [Gracilibacillus ureilyticus]|uniref:Putative Flp pilus-assembly TadE/G-like n=1 Tax=Gracilibacillus ureilyticus TaxID=531814 RepID=A0A1H9V4M7_9BACI|nr:Tad domain-containing protein [Gracilibacillus ureilyticus]SES16632.1 Putative Flp pilus-assembly TadE/G-like [Gracilibacillus ureilyticus]